MQVDISMNNEQLVEVYQGTDDKALQSDILGMLYMNNERLIRKIANRYAAYENIEDLMQEGGYFGLKNAVEMYDTEQEATFVTYAYQWIRSACRKYLDNCGTVLRYPVHKRNSVYKLSKITNSFLMEFNREPSDRELCSLLGISQVQLNQVKEDKARLRIRSLDKPLTEEVDSFTLGDTVADDHDCMEDIIDIEDNARLRSILRDELAALTPKEEEVIVKRYRDCMSLKEIGSNMGITAEGARHIESQAMRKLRKSTKLRQYREECISHAYCGTGLQRFLNTNTSSTERAAIELYEIGLRKYVNQLEKDISRIEKKYGIKLDEGYRQRKIEEYKKSHINIS